MIHQPKGGMCATCEHGNRDCTHLDFTKMPVISEWRGMALIVRCTDFKQREKRSRGRQP